MSEGERIIFAIEGQELENLRKWQVDHACNPPALAERGISKRYVYQFQPLGIGIGIKVKCLDCGRVEDISNDTRR